MKRLSLIGLAVLASFACFADPIFVGPIEVATVSTNPAAISTDTAYNAGTAYLYGYVDFVIVDITSTYGSPTCTVSVATTGDTGSGPSRAILSKSVAADDVYYPRRPTCTTTGDATNVVTRIPLYQDTITVTAYAVNQADTNTAVKVYVGLTQLP